MLKFNEFSNKFYDEVMGSSMDCDFCGQVQDEMFFVASDQNIKQNLRSRSNWSRRSLYRRTRCICGDCKDKVLECYDCGDIIHVSDAQYGLDYGYRCEDCHWDVHCTCYECGELLIHDNANYDYENEEYYCDYCYDDLIREREFEDIIKPWHYHKDCNHFDCNYFGTGSRKIGFELEVERDDYDALSRNEMAYKIKQIMGDHCVFELDGSLTDGFEIISVPHTLDEYVKILPLIEEMLQLLRDNGYRSHDGNDCGLHIHLSYEMFSNTERYHELSITKNLYKFVKFNIENYEYLRELSRRKDDSHTQSYCHINDDSNLVYNISRNYCDRYCAVNFSGSNTVEFRLGRGTLIFDTFKNWVDLTLKMVESSKTTVNGDYEVNSWI